MTEMEKLRETLKDLPKYSLDEEQKDRINRALRKETKSKKQMLIIKPFFVVALLCATLFVLALTSGRDGWLNDLKLSFQPRVELNAQNAVIFKNEDYDVVGIDEKIGILMSNEHFIAEDARRGSKLMLYFWGDPSLLIGKQYRVEAKNTYNSTLTLSEGILSTPLRSEDAHTLTSFPPFPIEGKWQLSFFVEDQLFDEFTMNILPPLPKTEHYTLIDSPMEMNVSEEVETYIESSLGSEKEIKVELLNEMGMIVFEDTFVREGDAADSHRLYLFSGKIMFPEKGNWTLLINGEKTRPFKN
ncbi:hypothetical protein ACFPRA_18445 [Sporosarcina soli]|uniref:DUF4179 domain-containing protein n=1 Tax=Sporosarcina soli TaxID=334736 RepID=A0ABW0TR39_9BACL